MIDKTKRDRAVAQIVSRTSWMYQIWPVIRYPGINLHWRNRSLDEKIHQISKNRKFLSSRIAYEKAAFRFMLPRCARRQLKRGSERSSEHRHRSSISARELDGVRLRIPMRERWRDNAFDRRLLTDRRYPLNLSHFRRVLTSGGSMIDIGAHVGTVSIAHALLGDFRRIHAFEPMQENFVCLQANIDLNGLRSVIVPHHCAMGSEIGVAYMREGSGSGQHQLVTHLKEEPEDTKPGVPLTTLDQVLKRIGRDGDDVSFVKSDTEGYDSHVLLGAREFLSARRAVWQMEFCPRLMERRGVVPMREFFDLIEASFDHFIADDGPSSRLVPVSGIRERLSQPLSRNHIDIFLIP